jgi:hypothetical protein
MKEDRGLPLGVWDCTAVLQQHIVSGLSVQYRILDAQIVQSYAKGLLARLSDRI